MTLAQEVTHIFADARGLQEAALERLEAGDIRDAADKAWCAMLRATAGLILARTGDEPERSPQTTRGLQALARTEDGARPMVHRYYLAQSALHGNCFYQGLCDPVDDIEALIRAAAGFVQDAEALADRSAV